MQPRSFSMLASVAVTLLALLVCDSRAAGTNATPHQGDLSELPLEMLLQIEIPKVYAASKLDQKASEAPSSITVVTADEIKRYGHRTLAEVLQSIQGLHVSYDRNYAFLGTRGVNLGDFNSRVLLLVNGHRVNNNLTDGAFIDTAFILDVDLIEQVEVIRGPGSVLYGNNAFFGVINVVTREARQFDGLEMSGEYGSFDACKARMTYGKVFTNGVQLLLSGSYHESDGADRLYFKEFDNPAQNNGVAVNMDADRYASCFGSLTYGDFTLESAFIRREKVNPTAQFLTTFNDPRLRTTDERGYAAIKYAHRLPGEADLTAQLYYDQTQYEIAYPVGEPAVALFQEQQTGQWWGLELQLNKKLWDRHQFAVGAEYRDDFEQHLLVFDQSAVYTDFAVDRRSYAFYLQADIAVQTNLHLTGGVRYDQVGDFDAAINPRLAVIYNPFAGSAIKAIYGSAFRAPNFTELGDPRFQSIRPEEITSYELVYEQAVGRHLLTSVSAFQNQMHDLIVLDGGAFTNLNVETKGVELAAQGTWAGGVRARASYSIQESSNPTRAWELPDSPAHLVKLNLSVPVVEGKLFASVEFQYTSSRRSLTSTTDPFGQPITVQGAVADGFGIVNLNLFSQNLVKDLEFSAGLYNVFDQRYSDPASRFHVQDLLERDGRTFRLKLTYHF